MAHRKHPLVLSAVAGLLWLAASSVEASPDPPSPGEPSERLRALIDQGFAHLDGDRIGKAMRTFRRADRAADGRSFDAAYGLAVALYSRQPKSFLEDSLEVARRLPALAGSPVQGARANDLLGTVLYESAYLDTELSGLYEEAARAYAQGLALDDRSASLHLGRGLARLQVLLRDGPGQLPAAFEPVVEHLETARALGLLDSQDRLAERAHCLASRYASTGPDRPLRPGLEAKVQPDGRTLERPQLIGRKRAERARSPEIPWGLRDRIEARGIIDQDGSLRCLWLTKGSTDGMDSRAIQMIEAWRYEPARLDGEPVAVFHAISYRF